MTGKREEIGKKADKNTTSHETDAGPADRTSAEVHSQASGRTFPESPLPHPPACHRNCTQSTKRTPRSILWAYSLVQQ